MAVGWPRISAPHANGRGGRSLRTPRDGRRISATRGWPRGGVATDERRGEERRGSGGPPLRRSAPRANCRGGTSRRRPRDGLGDRRPAQMAVGLYHLEGSKRRGSGVPLPLPRPWDGSSDRCPARTAAKVCCLGRAAGRGDSRGVRVRRPAHMAAGVCSLGQGERRDSGGPLPWDSRGGQYTVAAARYVEETGRQRRQMGEEVSRR